MLKIYNKKVYISIVLAFFITLNMLFCFWLGTKYRYFKDRKEVRSISIITDKNEER